MRSLWSRCECGHVVFAFGSEEKGQLGNGQAGERIVSAGKSAFDFEEEPSEFYFLILYIRHFNILVTSSRQGTCRAKDRPDCLRLPARDCA